MDTQLNIIDEFAQCFTGYRDPELTEHTLEELIRQRVYSIALVYTAAALFALHTS